MACHSFIKMINYIINSRTKSSTYDKKVTLLILQVFIMTVIHKITFLYTCYLFTKNRLFCN